jgi:hypothetical protein
MVDWLDPMACAISIWFFPACLMLAITIRSPAQRRWYLLLIVSLL